MMGGHPSGTVVTFLNAFCAIKIRNLHADRCAPGRPPRGGRRRAVAAGERPAIALHGAASRPGEQEEEEYEAHTEPGDRRHPEQDLQPDPDHGDPADGGQLHRVHVPEGRAVAAVRGVVRGAAVGHHELRVVYDGRRGGGHPVALQPDGGAVCRQAVRRGGGQDRVPGELRGGAVRPSGGLRSPARRRTGPRHRRRVDGQGDLCGRRGPLRPGGRRARRAGGQYVRDADRHVSRPGRGQRLHRAARGRPLHGEHHLQQLV